MFRDKSLIDKRREFVGNYVKENSHKQMKIIVEELVNMLFLTERTIYKIIEEYNK